MSPNSLLCNKGLLFGNFQNRERIGENKLCLELRFLLPGEQLAQLHQDRVPARCAAYTLSLGVPIRERGSIIISPAEWLWGGLEQWPANAP